MFYVERRLNQHYQASTASNEVLTLWTRLSPTRDFARSPYWITGIGLARQRFVQPPSIGEP